MPLICCLGLAFVVYALWWWQQERSKPPIVASLEIIPAKPLNPPTSGERLVGEALSAMGIVHEREYILDDPRIKHRRFDFSFERALVTGRKVSQRVVVEYDGEPHFTNTPYFHKTKESFDEYQAIDALKQSVAIELGYVVIRLHYSVDNVHLVRGHIEKALTKKRAYVYYSHPEHYRHLRPKNEPASV
jgi:very-short-patch-repair endonuclease